MKKKHFDTSSNNLITDIEYMRINAERERIRKYQDITKGPAYVYYKILKRLSVEGPLLLKEEQSQTPQLLQEPSAKIQRALYEQKL